MTKVSVIIPVYNVEEYLRECLDSIVNQTLKDIEIICVNDNSTDGSLKILEEYQQKDDRIIILNGKKTGAGGARNVGIEVATGEFLSFLDADDFFELDMYEKLYNKAVVTNSDIIICDVHKYNTNTQERTSYEVVIIPEEFKKYDVINYKTMPTTFYDYFTNNVWNKFFSRKLIMENGIRFQEIKRSNDVFFSRSALSLADRISYVDEKLVNYRMGLTNNLQSNNKQTPLEIVKALKKVKEFLLERNLYDDLEVAYKRLAIAQINYYLLTLKAYPHQYFKLASYLDKDAINEINITRKDTECWSNFKIFLTLMFSIRNYRGTNYKIVNFLGLSFKIKRKNG